MQPQEYFYALNYTLANEDTQFEYELIKKLKPQKIMSVCGSGSRAFPLINENTTDLFCVDLSADQLSLAKLREACFKQLSFDEFCMFWGYPPFRATENRDKRREIFSSLELDQDSKKYFTKSFNDIGWESLLYKGKWEKTFAFFSKVVQKVLSPKVCYELFSHTSLEEQRKYLKQKFPHWKWKVIMAILGNKSLFNALLYKGDFIKKNVKETYLAYYDKAFKHLMHHDLVQKSYFMQLCFFGEIIYADGNLIEGQEEGFSQIKKNLAHTQVHYLQKDIISAIKDENDLDFVSISDVPSYFSGDLERDFLQLLRPGLNQRALVVNRNYLRIPKANREGYSDIAKDYQSELDNEKVQMYRIEVLRNDA